MIRRTVWFSKASLVDAARYTAEYGLGEPPNEAVVLLASDERFPAVYYKRLTTELGEVPTFYRCGVYVSGEFYRVALTLEGFALLPWDDFDLPF